MESTRTVPYNVDAEKYVLGSVFFDNNKDKRYSKKEATKDIPNVEVDSFSGLLIDYANENDIHVAVRGLRAITDFEYELQIAQTNRKLSHEKLDTMFLVTSLENAYLSSSSVKEIASFGGDISECVPPFVADQIYAKFGIKR